MVNIVTNIPVWVLPLFLGLVWLGMRATRERRVSPLPMLAMPLMGMMAVNRAQTLPQAEIALTALALAFAVGALVGFALQKRWIIATDGRRVHLRGEWLTLATLLGLFAINFAVGLAEGLGLALVSGVAFAGLFGAVAGVLSGTLLGRALRVVLWSGSTAPDTAATETPERCVQENSSRLSPVADR